MYKLIADAMVLISLLIIMIAFFKLESLTHFRDKDVPLKIAILALSTAIGYSVFVMGSWLFLIFLFAEFFRALFPEGIPLFIMESVVLIESLAIYRLSARVWNSITPYLKEHGLCAEINESQSKSEKQNVWGRNGK
jgi:hypothetical protein